MKLIRQIDPLDAKVCGCALTIGNFDGVHQGHAKIIQRLAYWAEQVGGPSVVLTFDPHPVRLLRPQLAPPPLTWTQRKAELLAALHVDYLIAWPTDRSLLELSYLDFFQQVIQQKIQAAAVVEGPNFYFGKDRAGDVQRLQQLCKAASIPCEIVEPGIRGDALISSTRIREQVRQGDVRGACQMLTQPYRIRGMVVHGAGRGAEIGFPTANLDAIDTLIPAMGVYAGLATVDQQTHLAAIHIGPSPTFGVERPTVEIHLLNYNQVLYGKVIEIDFLEQLRGVQQFSSSGKLQQQLRLDVSRAREIGTQFLKQRQHHPNMENLKQ